ncbi:hypothetical protein AAG570_001375 [Ranatra chinensis]|uniref:Uncharacterized protein n=1 Tax=Ranatra chinensis TaxID=642074 RepID=A0ABD0YZX5_9HEMI
MVYGDTVCRNIVYRGSIYWGTQGSLTIVRRSSGKKKEALRDPSASEQTISLESVDLTTDNLPAVDTPDACDKAALRLRCLLRQLQLGEISAELLQKNLLYAARVLEAVFIDETKSLCRLNIRQRVGPLGVRTINCSCTVKYRLLKD